MDVVVERDGRIGYGNDGDLGDGGIREQAQYERGRDMQNTDL